MQVWDLWHSYLGWITHNYVDCSKKYIAYTAGFLNWLTYEVDSFVALASIEIFEAAREDLDVALVGQEAVHHLLVHVVDRDQEARVRFRTVAAPGKGKGVRVVEILNSDGFISNVWPSQSFIFFYYSALITELAGTDYKTTHKNFWSWEYEKFAKYRG